MNEPQANLLDLARRLLSAEKAVGEHFPGARCVDVSWSALLVVYVNAREKRPLDISGACFAVPAPTTTVLRRLDHLHALGFVDRIPDAADGRRTFVALSSATAGRIEACLRAIVEIHGLEPAGAR